MIMLFVDGSVWVETDDRARASEIGGCALCRVIGMLSASLGEWLRGRCVA